MLTRKTTDAELIADTSYYVSRNLRLRFRHFIKEMYSPRRRNQVRHVSHSKRVAYVKDGQLFVFFQDQEQKLTGTHVTLDNGQTFVSDVRLDSEYLKASF